MENNGTLSAKCISLLATEIEVANQSYLNRSKPRIAHLFPSMTHINRGLGQMQ